MKRWRDRARTGEAMLCLLVARFLVRRLALRRWRRALGPVVPHPSAGPGPARRDRAVAASVERAAKRLPGESKCLPRAIATAWMMRRRGRCGQLVIAVRPGQARGALDDLHAWFETGGVIIIGNLGPRFVPLARFDCPPG